MSLTISSCSPCDPIKGSLAPLIFNENHFAENSYEPSSSPSIVLPNFFDTSPTLSTMSDTSHASTDTVFDKCDWLTVTSADDPLSTECRRTLSPNVSTDSSVRFIGTDPYTPCGSPDRWQLRGGHFSPFRDKVIAEQDQQKSPSSMDGDRGATCSHQDLHVDSRLPNLPDVTSRLWMTTDRRRRCLSVDVEMRVMRPTKRSSTIGSPYTDREWIDFDNYTLYPYVHTFASLYNNFYIVLLRTPSFHW